MTMLAPFTWLAALLYFINTAHADLSPSWSKQFDEEIRWYQVTSAGPIVVADKSRICALDARSSDIIWEKTGLKKLESGCFESLDGTAMALVTYEKKVSDAGPRVAMIDVRTGEELWNTTGIGLGESYGQILLPPINAILFYGKQTEKPKKKFVAAVDVLTGEPIWLKQEFFKGWDPHLFESGGRDRLAGNQPPIFDADSTFILFLNDKSLRKYNIHTGEMIWETTSKLKPKKKKVWEEQFEKQPCAGPALGYAPMILSDNREIIYVPYQNTVGAFLTSDGASLWEDSERLSGIAAEILETSMGVLVTSFGDDHFEIKMLDSQTGKKKWKFPEAEGSVIKKAFSSGWSSCTNMLIEDSTLLVAVNNNLFRIDLKTGAHDGVGTLGFEGEDGPYALERREDCYLVLGAQNATWYSFDGTRERSVSFRPPDNIGSGLLSLGTALLFSAIGSHQVSGNVTVTFSGDYSAGLEAFLMDFSATSESEESFYILADPQEGEFEGLGLLRLSKASGDVTHRISLDTKEPDYQLNWYQNSLIMKQDKYSLATYQF